MACFDYDEGSSGEPQTEQLIVFDGLSEDDWRVIIKNSQNILFAPGDILLK